MSSFYSDDNIIVYVPKENDTVSVAVLSIPIWMSVDVHNGSEELIMKAVFAANMRDIYLLVEIILMVSMLIFILILAMFIKAIRSVLRKGKSFWAGSMRPLYIILGRGTCVPIAHPRNLLS